MLLPTSKRLTIVRHGQAKHNIRSEVARANGCTRDEYFHLMRLDDILDGDLTEIGEQQAKSVNLSKAAKAAFQLVVSSPLSRALQTADWVVPPPIMPELPHRRVANEVFRETNGEFLNGKRQTKSFLTERYPHWDWDLLDTDEDTLWTPELEDKQAATERGYLGLQWLLQQPEDDILLVCHSGWLKYAMNDHDLISMQDGREDSERKDVQARFDNCEARKYLLEWNLGNAETDGNADDNCSKEQLKDRQPVVLTEVDL